MKQVTKIISVSVLALMLIVIGSVVISGCNKKPVSAPSKIEKTITEKQITQKPAEKEQVINEEQLNQISAENLAIQMLSLVLGFSVLISPINDYLLEQKRFADIRSQHYQALFLESSIEGIIYRYRTER